MPAPSRPVNFAVYPSTAPTPSMASTTDTLPERRGGLAKMSQPEKDRLQPYRAMNAEATLQSGAQETSEEKLLEEGRPQGHQQSDRYEPQFVALLLGDDLVIAAGELGAGENAQYALHDDQGATERHHAPEQVLGLDGQVVVAGQAARAIAAGHEDRGTEHRHPEPGLTEQVRGRARLAVGEAVADARAQAGQDDADHSTGDRPPRGTGRESRALVTATIVSRGRVRHVLGGEQARPGPPPATACRATPRSARATSPGGGPAGGGLCQLGRLEAGMSRTYCLRSGLEAFGSPSPALLAPGPVVPYAVSYAVGRFGRRVPASTVCGDVGPLSIAARGPDSGALGPVSPRRQ